MKIDYKINHFDFVCLQNFVKNKYSYVAQSKNGTWHAFTSKPIIDEEFQMWKINPELKKYTFEYVIFNPFDGYPENPDWKSQLYTIEKLYNILKTQTWQTHFAGKPYSSFLNYYILFCDGTFGVIITLSNGKIALKYFNTTHTTKYNQIIDFIQLQNSSECMSQTGIIRQFQNYLYAVDNSNVELGDGYLMPAYRIATLIPPDGKPLALSVQVSPEIQSQTKSEEVSIKQQFVNARDSMQRLREMTQRAYCDEEEHDDDDEECDDEENDGDDDWL